MTWMIEGRGGDRIGGGEGEVGERDETERDVDEDEDENVNASEDAAERFCNADTDTATLRSVRRRGVTRRAIVSETAQKKESGGERYR